LKLISKARVFLSPTKSLTPPQMKKSSNKLRMKALVGWNTFSQVPELINLKVFFTRMKNDKDKEDKIVL